MRFNQAKSSVENAIDEMVHSALFQGLRPEGPLMADLTHREPDNLMGLMDKVDEYINQEETLRAMIGSRKNQASTSQNPEKKKKTYPSRRPRYPASSSKTTISHLSTLLSMRSSWK
jgi:hypothetical protein